MLFRSRLNRYLRPGILENVFIIKWRNSSFFHRNLSRDWHSLTDQITIFLVLFLHNGWRSLEFDNKSFIVNVLSVNDEGPVIDSIPDYLISEDTSLVIILSAYDYDGDAISYAASASDSSIHLAIIDSFLTINPAENWNGESEISVFASDGYLTDTSSFYFSVIPVNDPPTYFDLISPEIGRAHV